MGYELSPVLWKKVRRGLSAGRVQSVALRLVVDREREIGAFVPREYWSIEAALSKRPANGRQSAFKALFFAPRGQKQALEIATAEQANGLKAQLDGADFSVDSVRKKQTRSRPYAPFITSTLQQEASRKLRFTARRTMMIAQQLYEGLPIGDEGSAGLITYMRTDSTTVAGTALRETAEYIRRQFGDDYASKSPRMYKRKVKGAQEAHEAIRPTSMNRDPASVRRYLSQEQFRLYDLIWKRMIASQMTDALFDLTTIEILARGRSGEEFVFKTKGSVLKFPGFRAVYMEDADDSASGRDEDTPSAAPAVEGRSAGLQWHRAGAALHPAPASIHGGHADKDTRGAGDRPAQHLRSHDRDSNRQVVRSERAGAVRAVQARDGR